MSRKIVQVCPSCAEPLVDRLRDHPGAGRPSDTGERQPELAATEQELLKLLATGLTDEAIARQLSVSVRTERRMVAELMRRLGARGRFEAGVKAARLQWI